MRARGVGRGASLLLAAALLPAPAVAQAPPNTDVWLAPLSRVGDSLVVGAPRNVTARPGYDNQPSFTPDSRAILYTAVVDGQADVFRYELRTGHTTRLTSTPESEYSPTVMPDGRHYSVVRVERDSTQRLWRFPLGGGEPSLVLPDVEAVGYHAWVDDTTVALFVLGEPATLRRANVRTGAVAEVARGIGRSLQRIPGVSAFSFTRPRCRVPVYPAGVLREATCVYVVGDATLGASPLWMDAGQSEFHAWVDAGTLLGSEGTMLRWYRELPVPADQCEPASRCRSWAWWGVRDLSTAGLRSVTRLAVSPDGHWLAFVAEPVHAPLTKDR